MSDSKNISKSPLLLFLVIGFLLFGLNYLINGNGSKNTITLNAEEMESYEKMASNNGSIDSDIFQSLINKRIDQELLFQYGMSLNLYASNGEIKKQIIKAAQEVIMAQAPIGDPGDSTLLAFIVGNKRINKREVYSIEQYFFGTDLVAAEQALFLVNSGNAIANGDSINIPCKLSNLGLEKMDKQFGTLFTDSLSNRENGWRGIVKSNYGLHVIVSFSKKEINMNLENSREEIWIAWKKQEQKLFYNNFMEKLKQEAEIEIDNEAYQKIK